MEEFKKDATPEARRILLHYLNPEILKLYTGGADPRNAEVFRATLMLTRYAALVTELPLVIPLAYLYETPAMGIFIKLTKPLFDANLIYVSSPTRDVEEYEEKKRREYRDQLPLIPGYERTTTSPLKQLGRFPWIPRIKRSASGDIAKIWTNSVESGADIWKGILSDKGVRRTTLNQLEREIESLPQRLDGHAFLYKYVASRLSVSLSPKAATQIHMLINQGYLHSFLEEFNSMVLTDTPLGLLDCGQPEFNSAGHRRTLSFRSLVGPFRSLNVQRTIDSFLNWHKVILLKEHFTFRWLVDVIIGDKPCEGYGFEKAVRLSSVGRFDDSFDDGRKDPLQKLYSYLDYFYQKVAPFLGEPVGPSGSEEKVENLLQILSDNAGEIRGPLFDKYMIPETKRKTRSILFMDVAGWSSLKMPEIHSYVTRAMPALKGIVDGAEVVNTWGDAIVATYDSVAVAAETALEIRHFFEKSTSEEGISEGLTCRISLHLGEILQAENPITGKQDIFGTAVHLAARLEPITDPGHVFCSESFAKALAEVKGMSPKASFLEERELTKNFGRLPIYAVAWANEGTRK